MASANSLIFPQNPELDLPTYGTTQQQHAHKSPRCMDWKAIIAAMVILDIVVTAWLLALATDSLKQGS
jgi:hypothetical protein